MKYSASGLPRYCGYEKVLSAERPRPLSTKQAADAGTLFHALVDGDAATVAEMTAALPPGLVADAYSWLEVYRGGARVPDYAEHETVLGLGPDGEHVESEEYEPHKYRALDGKTPLLTAGRADLVWCDPDGCVYAADLKTGRTYLGDPDAIPQLMALGLAALARHGASRVRVGIWYARDGVWEWGERMSADEAIEAWLDEVREMAARDESPMVGDWCGACWERKACPQGLAYLEAAK